MLSSDVMTPRELLQSGVTARVCEERNRDCVISLLSFHGITAQGRHCIGRGVEGRVLIILLREGNCHQRDELLVGAF